jgi:flagellar biosynthesis protein FliP
MTQSAQLRLAAISITWLVAFGLGAAVTIISLPVGIILMVLALLGGASYMVPALQSTQQEASKPRSTRQWNASTSQQVLLRDGNNRSAFVQANRNGDSYRTVLTAEGMILVNHNGEEVYRLNK